MASYVKVDSDLQRIASELRPAMSEAMKKGAEAVAAAARERVPVRTGALRRAIHTEFEGDADWSVVFGDHHAFYGHMVEFGTTEAAPRPFAIPAFEANRRVIDELVREALKSLE